MSSLGGPGHAVYYLLPKGINELRKISKQKYLPEVLQNLRHDNEASSQFISHCLGIFDIYSALRSQFGEELQFFTKTQMAAISYFPKQLPDAHIQLGSDHPKLFLLELLHTDRPFFLATRAIVRYIDYADKDEWPTKYEFPKILLVCDSLALQKRLLKKMRHKIENLDNPELKFFITTLDQLKTDQWLNMTESDAVLTLNQT